MHRYQIPYIIILCLILLSCSSGRSVTPTWTQQDTLILALKEKCPSQSPSISPPIFEPDTCLHMQVNANIVRRLTYQKNGLVKYVCQDCGETLSQEETSRLTGKVLYGYAEIQAILDGFYDRYGIDYESIGKSVDGRNIYVYRLGDTSAEHHILVQAGIHGKEYMNTALMLNLTEYYLLNGDTLFQGKTLSDHLENTCFHIIPTSNPDGAYISQTQVLSPACIKSFLLENNVPKKEVCNTLRVWKANADGVDLNRNFDADWYTLNDGVGKPSYRNYKGPYPASEPETQALIRYTYLYPFEATLSYHSYGSEIYWEYGNDPEVLKRCYSLYEAVHKVTGYPKVTYEHL
ncbi:MAG TPA: hypothetical protein DER23_08455, partial [Clostridiales bacterium]|nr:hypothetical protein [Clostridiales bacterium]